MILLFGSSEGLIRSGDITHPSLFNCLDDFTNMFQFIKHFPVLSKLALNLPTIIARRISPGYVKFCEVCSVAFATIVNLN